MLLCMIKLLYMINNLMLALPKFFKENSYTYLCTVDKSFFGFLLSNDKPTRGIHTQIRQGASRLVILYISVWASNVLASNRRDLNKKQENSTVVDGELFKTRC